MSIFGFANKSATEDSVHAPGGNGVDEATVELVANTVAQEAPKLLKIKYKQWVGDGPLGFRAMAFIGGAVMTVNGFLGLFGVLLSPLHAVVEAYMLVFGAYPPLVQAQHVQGSDPAKQNWCFGFFNLQLMHPSSCRHPTLRRG